MGKMLETMSRETRSGKPPERSTGTLSRAPKTVSPHIEPPVEETPTFIEVGGGVPAEASADVLAHGPLPEKRGYVWNPLSQKKPAHSITPSMESAPVCSKQAIVPEPSAPETGFRNVPDLKSLETATRESRSAESVAGDPIAEELIVYHDPNHKVSRQFRTLLAGIHKAIRAERSQSLLFIPMARGIGATTAVLNLALTAVRDESGQVLVIDAGLVSSAMDRLLGVDRTPGLKEVLTGRLTLEKAIQTTCVDRLHVLTGGQADQALIDQTPTQALVEMIRQLKDTYKMIFLDGPVWGDAQAMKFCAISDCVFPVVPNAKADAWLTEEVVERLKETGACVPGALLMQQ